MLSNGLNHATKAYQESEDEDVLKNNLMVEGNRVMTAT